MTVLPDQIETSKRKMNSAIAMYEYRQQLDAEFK